MPNDEPIIQLLTEIRDMQREELAWRQGVMEQSLRLQRAGLLWQRVALLIVAGGAMVAVFINYNLYKWFF